MKHILTMQDIILKYRNDPNDPSYKEFPNSSMNDIEFEDSSDDKDDKTRIIYSDGIIVDKFKTEENSDDTINVKRKVRLTGASWCVVVEYLPFKERKDHMSIKVYAIAQDIIDMMDSFINYSILFT